MGIRGRRGLQKAEPPAPVTVTQRTIEEIEVALAEHKDFHFVRNLVAFNVLGESRFLPLYHECDMLVCSKSGYLTEIEIKRSWSDFLADFKKRHEHACKYGIITKQFFYCLPSGCLEKAYDVLDQHDIFYSGIITYDEDLTLEIHGRRTRFIRDGQQQEHYSIFQRSADPLFFEQRLELARLCSMRVITYKKKTFKTQKKRIMPVKIVQDADFYANSLRKVLEEFNSPRKDDQEFITGRAELAAAEYEECSSHGMSANQAVESAMSVLFSGISEE